MLQLFWRHLPHGMIDQRSERLHKIARQIQLVEHIIVEHAELRGVAAGRDLARYGGKHDAVAVIKRGVPRVFLLSGKRLSEKRIVASPGCTSSR